MSSGIAIVIDYEAMTGREIVARLQKMLKQLVASSADHRQSRSLILLSGRYFRDVKPDSPEFAELMAQRGAIFVGTYNFSSIDATKWEELEAQIAKDCAAAHREYHDGLYTRPRNAPGEPVEPLPAVFRRRRKVPDA